MYSVFLAYSDPKEAEAVRAALDSRGMTLAGGTTDGESALSMVRDLCPDILITDLNLTFISGLEVVRFVRRVFPWIQIVILGGSDDPANGRAIREMGIEEHLIKPVRPYELIESLQRVEDRLLETRRSWRFRRSGARTSASWGAGWRAACARPTGRGLRAAAMPACCRWRA